MKINPYVSLGLIPDHYTKFGRHYKLFDSLQEELGRSKKDSQECILIGPGAEGPSNSIITYQPYELANALRFANVKDYKIEVVNINPEVLGEMKKQPSVMMVKDIARFDDGFLIKGCERSQWDRYFYRFFRDDEVDGEWPFGKTVMIPDDVNSGFVLRQGDVIVDDFGKERYDVLVCTVVLSYYRPEVLDIYLGEGVTREQTGEVMEKLKNSVKPGGYMITTEPACCESEKWDILRRHENVWTGIHETSAALVRKKRL